LTCNSPGTPTAVRSGRSTCLVPGPTSRLLHGPEAVTVAGPSSTPAGVPAFWGAPPLFGLFRAVPEIHPSHAAPPVARPFRGKPGSFLDVAFLLQSPGEEGRAPCTRKRTTSETLQALLGPVKRAGASEHLHSIFHRGTDDGRGRPLVEKLTGHEDPRPEHSSRPTGRATRQRRRRATSCAAPSSSPPRAPPSRPWDMRSRAVHQAWPHLDGDNLSGCSSHGEGRVSWAGSMRTGAGSSGT